MTSRIAGGGVAELRADCPDGMKVLGGGFSFLDGADPISEIVVLANRPHPDGYGWLTRWMEYSRQGVARTYKVYAICAAVSETKVESLKEKPSVIGRGVLRDIPGDITRKTPGGGQGTAPD